MADLEGHLMSLIQDAEYQRERAAILATGVGLARLYLAEHSPEAAKEALDTAARQSRELLERLLPLFDTDRLLFDRDYSPAYQDEYQRLWHEAAAERDELRQQLKRLGWKRHMVSE